MHTKRPYPRAVITKKGAKALKAGHAWVFEGEVLRMEPAPEGGFPHENGCIVDVVGENGAYQGSGLVSERSKIRIRLITRNANDRFDEGFWRRKLQWAWEYRKTVMGARALPGCEPDTNCCRVIFSEADGFPGLIVDRYEDVLVAQVGTVGMQKLRGVLYPLLLEVLRADGQQVRGIYERNDSPVRAHEGLALEKGWWTQPATSDIDAPRVPVPRESGSGAPSPNGDAPSAEAAGAFRAEEGEGPARPSSAISTPAAAFAFEGGKPTARVRVRENGIVYDLDIENSQKTGFFLDQKYNRRAVRELARGKRVLDCFAHVGTFGLNAAAGGAAYVRCVDISEAAMRLAAENARLNSCGDRFGTTVANVLDYLPKLAADKAYLREQGGPFDLIVLDPPAFTKSRKTVQKARGGYREINEMAMRLLPRGGYLATCSCSHFMTASLLKGVVSDAARNAGVRLRQIEERQQAPDHPILWGMPETHYLDFLIFQVV